MFVKIALGCINVAGLAIGWAFDRLPTPNIGSNMSGAVLAREPERLRDPVARRCFTQFLGIGEEPVENHLVVGSRQRCVRAIVLVQSAQDLFP